MEFTTGLVSLNGKTAGTSPVTVRKEPSAKAKSIGEWKPGTPVAVISQQGDFCLVEAKGLRGWVNNKYLALEGANSDGQKVDKGE
jgi:SH3-like domain-containing protein